MVKHDGELTPLQRATGLLLQFGEEPNPDPGAAVAIAQAWASVAIAEHLSEVADVLRGGSKPLVTLAVPLVSPVPRYRPAQPSPSPSTSPSKSSSSSPSGVAAIGKLPSPASSDSRKRGNRPVRIVPSASERHNPFTISEDN